MVLAVRDDRLLQGDSSMGRDNAPSVQKRKCSPPWEPATRGFPSLGEGGGGLRPLQKAMLQLKPWRYLQVSHWEDGEENTRLREDVQRPLDGKEELKEIWNG